MAGMRPVAEIMICDFLGGVAWTSSQITPPSCLMSGVPRRVPMVVRTMGSGGIKNFGGQHSQML